MKILKMCVLFALPISFYLSSCAVEEAEPSTIGTFKSFGFDGIQDKYVFDEADTTHIIPFTFSDAQIFEFDVHVGVGANSTATEDLDFALGAHDINIKTLDKKGNIEFIIGSDPFLEGDEKVYLTLTSSSLSGYPTSKTIEITIKNVGGCPEYVHNDFVGDYTVVSDGWQDWTAGTVLTVENAGTNKLSFKYNCGADAKPIVFTVNPATFGISGDKQQYCSYELPPVTEFFGDIVEASSKVNTCDKELTVAIAHSAGTTNYGTGTIVLKKK
jgi:hypothetical protein